jgi:hypothetical protein
MVMGSIFTIVQDHVQIRQGSVRTLLTGEGDWEPHDLGAFVGAAVYRALRRA